MIENWLEKLPETSHSAAREAVTSTFGAAPIHSIDPVLGGASGALTFRLGVGNRFYLLRMETSRSPLRNPHQYACMRIAAAENPSNKAQLAAWMAHWRARALKALEPVAQLAFGEKAGAALDRAAAQLDARLTKAGVSPAGA